LHDEFQKQEMKEVEDRMKRLAINGHRSDIVWRQDRGRVETGWWEMGPGWRHDGGRIVTGWRQVDVDRLYTDLGQAEDRLEKVEGRGWLETNLR
jgi:hypothetical protein